MRIDWDGCSRSEWERLAAAAPACPFEQSWLYGDAYARRDAESVRRGVVFGGDAPLAIVQALARRFGSFVTLVQMLRGPVLLAPDLPPETVTALYCRMKAEIRRDPREILFWSPELPAGDAGLAIMRACRMRQILTGYASARIDLTQDATALRAALHGKWRNGLNRAEAGALRVDPAADGATLSWLLARYGALRRQRRFGGPGPEMLAHALSGAAPDNRVALRAFSGSEAVAGALFFRHGREASYLIGWAGDEGRRLNAGALLVWRAMLELQRRGVGSLDLGGIDTRRSPGIARFKFGTGGEPYTLAGTFA